MSVATAPNSSAHRVTTVCLLIALTLVAAQALTLWLMGQPPICKCGTLRLWSGDIWSAENSQQLTDWYTSSHLLHGVLFYALLWLVAPRTPVAVRFLLAIGLEVSWELLENSPLMIERYRKSALAQGYSGDSIVNSVSDTLSAALGFAAARALPVRLTVVLVIVIEVTVGYVIRDNLTLNVVQLVHPSELISQWQTGR